MKSVRKSLLRAVAVAVTLLGLNAHEAGAQLLTKVETITAISGAGTQDITTTGFQPKVVLFWITDRTSTGNGADARFGRGWATDSSHQGAAAIAWDDTTDNGGGVLVTNRAIILIDESETVIAEANLDSMNSDGFTLDWISNGGSRLVTYLALGGPDLTDAYVGSGALDELNASETITGVGFQPDGLLLMGARPNSFPSFGSTQEGHAFGVAVSTSSRHSSGNRARSNGSGTSGYRDDEAIVPADDMATPEAEWDLNTFNSDGFVLDRDVAGNVMISFLALEGVNIAEGILAQPTSTGNQTVSGVGFRPDVVLFDGPDTVQSGGAGGNYDSPPEMIYGVATSSTERAAAWIGRNGTPADTDLSTSAVIRSLTAGTPTLNAAADFVSVNNDGFVIDWTSADSNQRKVGWVALGSIPTEQGVETDADEHRTFQSTGGGVVFTSDLVGYSFYIEENASPNGLLKWAKTTDGGASWGSETTIDADTQVVGFGIWYDQWTPGDTTGTNIYVAYFKRSSDAVHFYTLDTSSDTPSGPTLEINLTSVQAPDGTPSITKATDGDLYIFAGFSDVWESQDGGSTWNSITASFLNDEEEQGNLMPLSGADILFTYLDCPCGTFPGTYNLRSRVWDDSDTGTGTWGSEIAPFNGTVDMDLNNADLGTSTYWGATVNKSTGDVYLTLSTNAQDPGFNADIETYLFDDGARTWSQQTNVLTNNTDGLMDAKVSLDSCGNVYAIYGRGTDIFYKVSTDDMSTWGSEQQVSDVSGDPRSIRPDLMNADRIYTLWHDETARDVRGDTVIDLSGSCPTLDVTVSADGTQTASMLIPSTDQYVGAKFIITENTSSRNVTGITITAGGTVDAQNDLDNIKLYYELDTSDPYDGASESFGGSESQFGSTDTDGFDGSNQSAFSGSSVGISATATMVVYVVLDVGSGATDSETLEISIADPSSEVTVSSGSVEPATAVALSGTTTLVVPADLTQSHYRWRNDDGGEVGFDTGDGADGALTNPGSFDLNVSTSGARSYADGIAYRIDASTATGTSVDGDVAADDFEGIVAGDEVLLINLQGASGDTADVGNYEFLEVQSATSTTLTFTTAIQNSYDGTTPGNQLVVVQRVPNYTSVTLGSADTLTASAWDSLSTAPTGTTGRLTGLVVFRATGTVSIDNGGSIDVNGLGYRGTNQNTGAPSNSWRWQGEGYAGGYLTDSGSTAANAEGGGAGHAAGDNDASTGIGGGGGGGYGTGGGDGSITQGVGFEGLGGGTYGVAALTDLFPGSGGASGGHDTDNAARNGGAGGNAGGIVYVLADTVTVTATGGISSNGINGANSTDSGCGGGGGSGGSILLEANTATLDTNRVTASGGGAGSGQGSQAACSGGTGGSGLIHVGADTITGSTSPAADTSGTPSTGSGGTWAAGQDTGLTGLAKETPIRLRFQVWNNGGTSSGSVTYQLQFQETAACGSGSYTTVPTSATDDWQIIGSSYISNGGDPTSNISPGLADAGSVFIPGELRDDANATNGITLAADEFTEIEFAIQATTLATAGGDYCFQLRDSSGAQDLDTYSVYAEVQLAGPANLTESHYRWRNDDEAELGFYAGDGGDGPLVPGGTFDLNVNFTGARSYADGIAYRIDAATASGTSVDRHSVSDTLSNGIAAGDEVLLVNLQGTSGDTADVGNYEFLEVQSVSASTITFASAIQGSYGGTTPTNQMVVVQRVPNYTDVTLVGGDTLTASAWDGLTTTPSGSVGYLTGIVAFRATGTVDVQSGASISANALGYQGGTGGTTGGGINGESYDGIVGSGGDDTVFGSGGGNPGTAGGGSSTNNTAASPAGTRGGGGGGGNADQSTTLDGGGGGAGGGYGGGGGGGAGGGDGIVAGIGGTGGATGIPGGGGGTGDDNSGPHNGGPAGGAGTGPNPGAVGAGATTGGGGGGGVVTSGGVGGGGGGGGGLYGAPALTQLFHGSGGGGGGGHDNGPVAGDNGGAGGGIIFIIADTVNVVAGGAVTSNGGGGTGLATPTRAGASGGGSGGSVLIEANNATIGTSLVAASGGAGGPVNNFGGGGGAGGVGRIHIGADTITGSTTSPVADTSGTPSSGVGATWAAAEDTKLTGLDKETPIRLRFQVWNSGGTTSGSVSYQLQFQETATCSGGSYTTVPTSATDDWQIIDSSYINPGGDPTSNVTPGLADAGSTFVTGELRDDANATNGITLAPDEFTEIEFSIQATTLATGGADYCFRLVDASGPTALDTYSAYGEVQLSGFATDVIVSTSDSQTATVPIPGTDEYVGGKFVITDNNGSRNVTDITISESGTVDASANLDNIELWYEIDDTDPYNGASVSFDGDETQFGSTVAAFSGADGTATFSDSIGISTTGTLVVYVVFDVGLGATDGETVEISIADPSTQVITDSGTVGPATAVAISGTTTLSSVQVLDQIHYRWRNDNGDETGLVSGDGADGALAPSGTFDLNVDTSGARSYADGIAYRIDASTATGTSVDRYDAGDTLSNGIAAGDEVLLINLQGFIGDTADVGNYEFLEVQSVSASTINFTTTIQDSYDGTTAANQRVIVQRVPNYTDVTLGSGDILTASDWDGLTTTPSGTAGYLTGLVVFRASGLVDVQSGASIHVNGKGYRGGNGVTGTDLDGFQGESYTGNGQQDPTKNWGGGGAGSITGSGDTCGEGGAGGGYGSLGTSGSDGIKCTGGAPINEPGDPYGVADLSTIFLGSGGGSGGNDNNSTGASGDGGDGAGVILIYAGFINVDGALEANGSDGLDAPDPNDNGNGGGGAAGSIFLAANAVNLAANSTEAIGGLGSTNDPVQWTGPGGDGGVGRIHIAADSITGTASPSADTAGTPGGGTGTWAADQDTKLTGVSKHTVQRVRFEVSNEGDASSGSVTYELQFAESASCDSGSYTTVPTSATDDWQIVGSSYITDGEASTNIPFGLADEASTFVSGELKDTGNTTGSITLDVDEFTEIEFAVLATSSATDGGDYCFRLYDATGGQVLDAYSAYADVQLVVPEVTVSTSATQTPIMLIPSADQYVGGKFVITDNTGSRNVTDITITESGTVDASTDLDNIELWYEIDDTDPYDGASVSFDGDETQFGSTDTDGFTAADGLSSFSGSVGISTTEAMVVYVLFDVGAGASDAETVEIGIDDPPTEVLVDSGTASPVIAVDIAGTTTLADPAVTVSTVGAQVVSLAIPSTTDYVGGKFLVTDLAGSRNVTGITITESGTVDGSTNLANIELWYEIDNTAPYDGASVSFDGDETQFGSTAGAFSAADGTATFGDSVGISTTGTMVVYVVFDVGAGATDGETVEISIDDPVTDVTLSTGLANPDSAVAVFGTTILSAASCDGTVRTGTVTITTSDSLKTDTITPALTSVDNAFLLFSIRTNEVNPRDFLVSGQITDTSTVTFERQFALAANDVTIEWSVVEFASGVSVQRGKEAVSGTQVTTIPLTTSVDPTKSFPIVSMHAGGTNMGADDFVRAEIINNGDDLQLSFGALSPVADVEWQVVEYTSSNVQTGTVSFADGDSTKTANPTNPFNPNKSWLLYSYETETAQLFEPNMGRGLVRGAVTDGSTLTFDRDLTGLEITLQYYLVEFTDETLVQHDNQSFGTGDTQQNVTIRDVTTSTSIPTGGYFGQGGKSPYAGDDNPGVGWFTLDLTSSTNLQITRDVTGSSTADIYWSVLEFCSVTDVLVTSSNAQVGSMLIGDTDQYVGGKFVIMDNNASRNVTDITITESGTVDASTDLDNIQLWYEIDNTAPYDGASVSFDGDETQFGSTDADGFSAANGTSSFSGSVGISTTSAMVVYVVFDVSGGTAGETVEISIEDPSTEVTLSSGTPSPDTAVELAGITTLSDPACGDVVSVQSNTATIAATQPSTTATLSPPLADISKAFLVFSATIDDNRPEYTWVSGQITNTTTVTFERDNEFAAGAAVDIEWYVVEFAAGVTVQRGTQFMDNPTKNVTLPSSVDATKSFPIVTYRNGSGNTDDDDFIRARIVDGGATLELSTVTTPYRGYVEWQVVQYDNAFVQTGDVSFGTGDGTKTDSPTQSVNASKSWLIYNYYSDDPAVADDMGAMLVRGEITDGSTLTFDRENTGQNIELAWFLVEFNDATLVQHENQSFTNAETQKDVTINSVSTTTAIADGGYYGRGGKSPYSADDNPGVGFFTLDLTSSTNLQITRATTGSETADIFWSVVDFCSLADVVVSASGTQTPTMSIPTTSGYVGAKFVISDNQGSRNVTDITITESGTVDASADLSNVKLFYELDTTAPYDGVDETFAGTESQFGSTVGAFSGADGTAAFNDSVGISTTAAMVVYVVFDVGSGATDGETVEISIEDPSTEVTVSSGTPTPDTAVALSGTTTLSDNGLVTLSDANAGQITNQFTSASYALDIVFYRFKLTLSGTSVDVDQIDLDFDIGNGVANGDVTNAELWADTDGDGAWDSGSDSLIQGSITPSGGTISFTQDFTPISAGRHYFVVVDVAGLTGTDYTFVSLASGDITPTGAGTTAGTATDAGHAKAECPSGWWDCDWRKRRKITFDNTGRGDLDFFPAMICLSDPDDVDYSATQDMGEDVRFVDDDDATALKYEIEQWNEAGVSYLWVKVPTIDGGVDTDFVYLYYDNPTASDNQSAVDVWNGGGSTTAFESVYHLSDDFADSTGIHSAGTNVGSVDTTTNRLSGDHQSFAGSEYIDLGWIPSYGSEDLTWEGWYWSDGDLGSTDVIMSIEDRYAGGGDNSELRLGVQSPNHFDSMMRPDGNPKYDATADLTSVDDGAWHHLAFTRNGTEARFYWDGLLKEGPVSVSGGSITFPDPHRNPPWDTTRVTLMLGAQWATDDPDGSIRNALTGALDEMRTTKGEARSDDWIEATYETMRNCTSFSTVEPEDPTPTCTWGYRKRLTIDDARVACTADMTDYPVLVSLTDNDLRSTANGGNVEDINGYDIMFRDASLADLEFEIEEYDPVNGTLNAWVLIPALSYNSPTVFYVYYGNSCVSTPQENPTAVWSSDYAGVWHYHDDVEDSTSHDNDVTTQDSSTATGQIADGEDFVRASSEHNVVDYDATLDVGDDFTISAWVKRSNTSGSESHALLSKVTDPDQYSIKLSFQNDVMRMDVGDDVSPTFINVQGATVNDLNWHHIVGRADGSELTIFLDGVDVSNPGPTDMSTFDIGYDTGEFWMGASQWTSGPNDFTNAVLDEVRLMDTALDACLIETEFNNQDWPTKDTNCTDDGFICVGTQQTTAVGLTSFEATALDGAVLLEWVTGSEIDNLGFHLYRSDTEDGTYQRVTAGLIPGLGSSPEGASYSYVDSGLTNGETYYYKLEDVETTGVTEMHGPVWATPEEGASAGEGEEVPGGDERADEDDSEEPSGSRITYGKPWENEVKLRQVNGRTLEIELLTKGFYAYPEEDGSVRLAVPGLELFAKPGEPAVPVYRGQVPAVVGQKVRVSRVRVDEVDIFTSLRPSATEAPDVISSPDGTTRAGKRKVRRKFLKGKGLYPEQPARLVETVFQEDQKKALVEMSPIRWDEDGARLLLAKRMTLRVRFRGKEPSERELQGGGGRRHVETHEPREVLARFVTTEAGLYGVGFDEIFEKGTKAIRTDKLRLSHQGESVAFRVAPGAKKFNRKSTLYFISEGPDANPYGNEAVYELERSDAGVQTDKANGEPYGLPVLEYWRTESREENLLYQSTFVEAEDIWQWDWIGSWTPMSPCPPADPLAPLPRGCYGFQVENLTPSPSAPTLEIWLQGGSDFPELDHHARVYVNGTLVTEEWWDGETGVHLTAEIGPGVLLEGENVLEVENVGDTDAAYSIVYLDRFEVTYSSQVVAPYGELQGSFDQSGTAWLTDLEGGYVLDTTGEHPVWLDGVNHSEGVGFATLAEHEYLVVGEDAVHTAEVRKPLVTSLRSEVNAAEYLVIGPREFLSAAEPLLRYRLNEGLRTMAVAVEDIYSEFGYGEETADSIHEFLSYAYHHWSEPTVRYVVLLGDATYDTKDYLGARDELDRPVVNRVPAKVVKTEFVWTASDPTLGAVNGEDLLPDLAIGRLPAASVEEVEAMVSKILAYETGTEDPEAPIVLVVDNPDSGGDFEWNAQDLTDTVLLGLDVDKLELSELGTAATRSKIVNAFDTGSSIMSYIGHGGIEVWANENLLHRQDVAWLSSQSQQPLLFTMNCLNGYFHFPYQNSLAEELLKAEDKGIIAAFSPAGLSQDEPAHRFHKALLDELVNRKHDRLGDAILAGQADFADSGALPELLSIYHLLGDPALKLR